jgi:hypothetical protein
MNRMMQISPLKPAFAVLLRLVETNLRDKASGGVGPEL